MNMVKIRHYLLIATTAMLPIIGATTLSPAAASHANPNTLLKSETADLNKIDVQRRRVYRSYRRSNWVAPAIAIGVLGAVAAATANQYYYAPYGYYPGPYAVPYGYYYQGPYAAPYYYAQPARHRCWIETDPVMLRGYWTWCR